MKILHILETLSPNYGGPVRVLTELTAVQQQAGHHVTVATTGADHPQGVYHAPGWDTLANGAVPVFYGKVQFGPLRLSLDLASYLRNEIKKFDLVHIHGLYRFPPTYAAYQARKQGVPYVIRPFGSLDPFLYRKSSRSLRLKRLYEYLFDLPNLHKANAIHYTAEEERERTAFLKLRAPYFVVPNGLSWEAYESLPQRSALRARSKLEDAAIVLFLGRLHFKKGLDILIPAFRKVRDRNANAHLLIAGPENDEYGQQVRKWVKQYHLTDAVHFVGMLQGSDVTQAYVDADVFALPSYTENFGMTVAESAACGLPVVISNQVNIHQEVAKAGAGLVTQCNVDEVADALDTLLRDRELRYAMGQSGRRMVREYFTWESIVQSMSQQYQKVLDGSIRDKDNKALVGDNAG